MRSLLTVLIVVLAGLAGLAFVFTDVLVVSPGPLRVALAGVFYVAAGFLVARVHAGDNPFRWAVACGWGTAILGLVGLWVSMTDSGSGDFALATIFLVGPALSAWLGAFAGRKTNAP